MLARLYRAAAARLRVQLAAAMARGAEGTALFYAQQLDRVLAELRALDRATRPLAQLLAFDALRVGAAIVDVGADLRASAAFTGGPLREAAQVVAENLANRLGAATVTVGRRSEDALRRVQLEEVGRGVAAGSARREVSAAIARRLVEDRVTDALTGVVDRAGRRWQLDTYAEMAARTATREAVTAGTKARLQSAGLDLVTVSQHAGACPICVPFEGQTYSVSGNDPEYDPLGEEPPFHPNCEHVLYPAGANLDRLEAELGVGG